MPANPFSVQPANPLVGLQDIVGGAVQQRVQVQQQQEQKRQLGLRLQQASKLIGSEDIAGLTDFMVQNPDLRDHLIDSQKFASEATRANKIQSLKEIILGADKNEVMQKHIGVVQSEGGDTTESEMFLQEELSSDEAIDKAMAGLAIEDPQAAKALTESEWYKNRYAKKQKKFAQGAGKMAGYSFDPETGKFSIDPQLQRDLQEDALKQASKEKLGPKDVAGINDKVTALTKDVRGIHAAAKSLEGLKKLSSAAAKIGAVFKFMKALDPTSTVRPGELGLVYSAEGAAQGLANQVNKLLGKGAISETGFEDLVNTSKVMANSAIESSRAGVSGYLNVIADNLTPKQVQRLNARVPDMFEIEEAAEVTKKAPQEALDFLQANPEAIDQFEAKYGYRPGGF